MLSVTKNKIVQAAKKIIWENGFRTISVSDICEEAKISRMTFYRHYDDKYYLVKEILNELYDDVEIQYDIIYNQDIPFIEKIMQVIDYNSEATKGISTNLIGDIINESNEKLKEFIREKREFQKNINLKYIIREQKKGNFREDISVEFISFYLDHLNNLILDQRLSKMFESTDILMNQIYKMFYFGILNRK